MSKPFEQRTRMNKKPPKVSGTSMLIFKGVLVSWIFAFTCTLFLSLISMVTDNTYVDFNIQIIMVGVTMLSIFIGSAYATKQAASKGLFIGIIIGLIYVLVTVAFGMELHQETSSLYTLTNKFVAGAAAGIVGGLVGVNL